MKKRKMLMLVMVMVMAFSASAYDAVGKKPCPWYIKVMQVWEGVVHGAVAQATGIYGDWSHWGCE